MSASVAVTEKPSFGQYWKAWDLWVLILPMIAMSALLLVQFQRLMNRPERQFFPILILIAFYFPVRYIIDHVGDKQQPIPVMRLRIALGILGLAVLLHVAAALLFSPWMEHLAAIMVFWAWGLGRCVGLSWSNVTAWAGLLLVTLPLPLQADESFIGWLQATSSAGCSYVLDALSIPHMRQANVIEIKGHQLFVEEACSGIGSMYALLAAAALLVLLNGRSFLASALVLLSVPVWAMMGNLLRLLAIALAQHLYDRDLSHGLDHELLGLLTFSLAALGLWMTEWLVTGFLQPLPPTSPEFSFIFRTINAVLCWPNSDPLASIIDTEDETPQERAARQAKEAADLAAREAAIVRLEPWSAKAVRVFARSVAAVAIVIGVLPAIVVSRDANTSSLSFGISEYTKEQLEKMPGEEAMPPSIGQWRRASFAVDKRSAASAMGAQSLIWEYRKGDQRYLLSVDFPFRGFHAVEICYGNSGWNVEDVKGVKDPGEDAWDWREISMNNLFGSRGFVCYALMADGGKPFGNILESSVSQNLGTRLTGNYGGRDWVSVFQPLVFQIQLICESGRKLSDDELNELRDQFVKGRHHLREQILKSPRLE